MRALASGVLVMLLLCVLGLGQGSGEEPGCGAGSFKHGTGNNTRCCVLCAPEGESCPEGDCQCVQPEFYCKDSSCSACEHHPCPPGQEVKPYGKFLFKLQCVDCAVGTFSPGHQGRCRPWAKCDQLGFLTVFPGNKTHNAMCTPGVLPIEQHGPLMTVVLALAACILLLTTAQLGLHILQWRRKHVWHRETQSILEVQQSPAEDACSCQFPEEELGERMEEKSQLGDRWA